eukprot:UN11703
MSSVGIKLQDIVKYPPYQNIDFPLSRIVNNNMGDLDMNKQELSFIKKGDQIDFDDNSTVDEFQSTIILFFEYKVITNEIENEKRQLITNTSLNEYGHGKYRVQDPALKKRSNR